MFYYLIENIPVSFNDFVVFIPDATFNILVERKAQVDKHNIYIRFAQSGPNAIELTNDNSTRFKKDDSMTYCEMACSTLCPVG